MSGWFDTRTGVGAGWSGWLAPSVGLVCAGLVASTTACDDHQFNSNEPPSGVFLEDVLEIVDGECISCHAGLTAEAGLDLSTDFCSNVNGRIIAPNAPEFSLMYLRMRSTSEPMPPTGRLSTDQIELVKTWIEDGAPCDGSSYTGGTDTGPAGEPGAQLYALSCASCHGTNGQGVSGPAMASVVPGKSAEDIASIALNGSGGMPPVMGNADDAQTVGEWVVQQWGD